MSDLAEQKRRQREERLSRARTKTRLRVIVLVVAVVGVVAGAIWVYGSDVFKVKDVKVVGAERLSVEQVTALADVPDNATLLKLPVAEIEKRVESSPWVADVKVARDFPGTLRIEVAERKPFVGVLVGRVAYLVDEHGVVLTAQPATSTTLPLIKDVPLESRPLPSQQLESKEFENALAVLKALPAELRDSIDRAYAKRVDDLRLVTESGQVTESGLEILFGRAEDLEKKVFVVEELIKKNPTKIIYIDVRAPDAPTAKYAP